MRYKERKVRLYFYAAFASRRYEYLEAEGLLCVIRLKANEAILQRPLPICFGVDARLCGLLPPASAIRRPRSAAWPKWSGTPGAGSSRRLHRHQPVTRVVAFYNHRGTAEQYIKEGKNAQLEVCHVASRNNRLLLTPWLGNFMRGFAEGGGALVDRSCATSW